MLPEFVELGINGLTTNSDLVVGLVTKAVVVGTIIIIDDTAKKTTAATTAVVKEKLVMVVVGWFSSGISCLPVNKVLDIWSTAVRKSVRRACDAAGTWYCRIGECVVKMDVVCVFPTLQDFSEWTADVIE